MWARRFFLAFGACFFLLAPTSGCDRQAGPANPPSTAPAAARPTVASLVPAATDILLDMGAGDHLVAVSNYDIPRDGIRNLPKVGDYETVDWEQIATLRPELMVTQYAEDRMPQGLRQRQAGLGIGSVNIHIDSLDDILKAYDALGAAVGEPEKARAARDRLRARLDALRAASKGRPAVSVLIATDPTGLHLAGPGTFLDGLLPYIGATNAAASLNNPYPGIDREMLRSLDPDVIFQLLPDEPPQVVDQARRVWASMPELKAVKNRRVFIFTDWYLLQPGPHVVDLAEKMEKEMNNEE
jgi:ABC-type Fe3+-hydroxamate transport system substrate-binding protein